MQNKPHDANRRIAFEPTALPGYVDRLAGTVVLDDDGLEIPAPFDDAAEVRVATPTVTLVLPAARLDDVGALLPTCLAGPPGAAVEHPELAPDLVEFQADDDGIAVYRIDDRRSDEAALGYCNAGP